jgi:hypothetical protein
MDLAMFFWHLGSAPLDERAALLAERRESLPPEERAEFDATARMMLRRYREMFAEEPAGEPDAASEPPPASATEATRESEEAEEAEPAEAEAERKTSPLARLFRRRG